LAVDRFNRDDLATQLALLLDDVLAETH